MLVRGRWIVGLSVLLCAAASAAHPNDPPPSPEAQAAAREVMAAREAIKGAAVAKDVAALQKLITPDFTHTHGSGKVDGRDARIISLVAGEPVIELATVEELRVRVHGPATAIVSGKSPILNRSENRNYDFRWMQVYVKDGSTWRLAVSQATRLPAN
jgi:hypothetical protein